MFLNLVISKSATKYHYLSTMAHIIGQAHKLGKQKQQRPGITNDYSNEKFSTSHSHDEFDEYIYVGDK